MRQEHLISVIIPTINRPDNLQRAIKTVFNQIYQNIEIIVVDDSNKENLQLNKQHIKLFSDPRIKHMICKDKSGPSFAINKGIKEAKGNFIALLYDTDEWLTNKLEKQLKVMLDNPNIGLIVCHSLDKRFKKEIISQPKETITYTDLLKSFHLSSTSSYFVKKDAIEKIHGFDTELQFEEEYDLAIRLSKYHNIKTVPEVLVIRNALDERVKRQWNKKVRSVLTIYKKHYKEYKILGTPSMLFNHFKAIGLLFTFFFAFIFHNKVYKIINPIKKRYEGG